MWSKPLRMLLGTVLLLAASPAPATPSPDDESFYFSKGTRWTYEGSRNGAKKTVSQEVIRVSTGELFREGEPATLFHLEQKTVNVETDRLEMELVTAYLALEGGYLLTGSLDGPPVRIYKLNSRKGDRWPCIDPRIRNNPQLVFTHVGEEEITVPAGTYTKARHIRLEVQVEGIRHVGDLYIVPGIGIIKSRTLSEASDRKNEVILELKKFSPAREY